MQWIHDFQLFLFDFDGLLVNTEELHFQAYKNMCQGRGFELNWDFATYCQAAHYSSEKLKECIYKSLPELYKMEPDWGVLYNEKKEALMRLLDGGHVHLMPGVEALLKALEDADIPSCVVTNSTSAMISAIRKQNPFLNTIDGWFTRESYTRPKPHPECYLNAIAKMGKKQRIIGFEDTPRGLQALMQTPVKPVFISQVSYPEVNEQIKKGLLHFSSLDSLPKGNRLA